MQINPISYGCNTNFNAQARIHLNNGSTALADVTHNKNGNMKELSVKILKNRKELGTFDHEWARGIKYARFLKSSWMENIYKRLKITEESDQEKISDVIFHAELNEIIKENDNDPEALFNDTYSDVYPDDAFPYDEIFI